MKKVERSGLSERHSGLGGRGNDGGTSATALGRWGRRERRGSGRRERRRGEREGQVGGMGGGRGVGAALSSPVAGEVVRRGPAPVPTPVGGTGKGRERPSEVGQASWAWGRPSWARVQWGGGSFSFFFLFVFSFVFSFFYLFFLLFYFNLNYLGIL